MRAHSPHEVLSSPCFASFFLFLFFVSFSFFRIAIVIDGSYALHDTSIGALHFDTRVRVRVRVREG